MKECSYLVVNWNTKALTDGCIASLVADSRDLNAEIIVVDNGSTDGSIEMIRARHPEVQLITNGVNLGFARANNIGLSRAAGEFVFLVNSDAKVLPGCTSRMIACLRAHPRLGMIGPRVVGADLAPQQNCWEYATLTGLAKMSIGLRQSRPHRSRPDVVSGLIPLRRHFLSGCALMVRRAAAEEVGLFDERFFFYGEDMDWCRRMLDGGWRIAQLPSATVIHFGGASSSRGDTGPAVQAERALFQYLRKHRQAPLEIMRGLRLFHHMNRISGAAVMLAAHLGDRMRMRRLPSDSRAVIAWLLRIRRTSPAPAPCIPPGTVLTNSGRREPSRWAS